MQRLLAIALLTVKAAFRFRLVLALAVLLVATVVALPPLIKHDGSARGFTQIVMTYTLGAITTLLGFATLWLACGTMARDIEECQMQVVAVKPVARWEIWLGKWLGIMLLNALLLSLSAGAVFGFMLWRARELPEREREILRNEVLVARGSVREPMPDIKGAAEQIFLERMKKNPVSDAERPQLRKQIEEQVKWQFQLAPPEYLRRWELDFGFARASLKDQPLFIRVKFHTPQTVTMEDPGRIGALVATWEVGPPESPQRRRQEMRLTAGTFHEIPIPPNLFDEKGKLTIDFQNHNDVPLLFPLEDGFEVLYREGGFGLNFFRGVAIIFCWLGLLAALGLAAASFLSFPVAAFLALGLLFITMCGSTVATVATEGTYLGTDHDTSKPYNQAVDTVAVPVFRTLAKVINFITDFSPIDSLSSGRSITWTQLAQAFAQIVLLMGGTLGVIGVIVFTRRELATAQGTT